jgi:acyl-CoA synthetase (NDP forming)
MTDIAARAESLRPLFWPRSVAVLGASDNPNKIGGIPVRSFKEYGYEGDFYPINPTRDTVQELTAYPSLAAVAGPVDVAIMAVPARIAIEAAEDCAA